MPQAWLGLYRAHVDSMASFIFNSRFFLFVDILVCQLCVDE